MKTHIDFIFQNKAKQIFDTFTRLLDVRIVFFSSDGIEIIAGAGRPLCEYCGLLRYQLGLEQNCRKNDLEKQAQAGQKSELIVYTCHGGMIEAVLPVNMVNRTIGYIMIGQFRNSRKCPAGLRNMWKSRKGNDELYEAFLKAPYYTKQKTETIMELFSLFTEQIISQHLIITKSSDSIARLISFIDENPHLNISLNEAADMIHMSTSSLSHQFRKITGKSFKQYIIDNKLAVADKWLKEPGGMKVYQIAEKLGYNDPYFFSRLYKKHRGYSPMFAKNNS